MQHFYRTIRFAFFSILFLVVTTAKSQVLLTTAGNVNSPHGVAVDKAGNIYFTDWNDAIVEMITPAGVIDTIAGIADSAGFSGNGGLATAAKLNSPIGIALDDSNNIYIADNGNNSIRKIYKNTGIIVSIAGVNDTSGYGGDNGLATSTAVVLNGPYGIAVDAAGNVYFSDANNYIVRKINKATGIITTVAGIPQNSTNSDSAGIATTISFGLPEGICLDKSNNLYIADNGLDGVFKVNFTTDSMTYIVGAVFTKIYNPTPTLANDINMSGLQNVVADSLGNIFISNPLNYYIYKVNKNDSIFAYAGTGSAGSANNVMANMGAINGPSGMAFDDSLNLFFADLGNGSINEIRVSGPNIIAQPPSTITVCQGLSANISLTVTGSGISYVWTVDSAGGTTTITNNSVYSGATTNTLHINAVNNPSLIYQCNINGGYVSSNQFSFNIVSSYNFPDVYIYSNNYGDTTCPGEAVTLNTYAYYPTAPPHNGNGSPHGFLPNGYYWNNGDSGTTITVYPTKTTQYIVTYYGSCPYPDTITTYVSTNTIKPHAFPSSSICSGTSITLYGSGGSGTYTWSDTNGIHVTNDDAFQLSKSGNYIITGIDSNGCADTSSLLLTALPSPVITITATPKDTVCLGSSIILHGLGAANYNWSGGISDNVAFTPTNSSVYYVTGTSADGCTSYKSIPVIVNPLPTATGSSSPDAVCAGGSVVLTGNGGASYSWSGGVSNGVPFVPLNSGTYTVTAASTFGCTNTASVAVTVNPKPVISATAFPSAALCQGSSLALFGSGGASYAWSGGVNNGVSFTPASSITYTLTGIDDNGCTNTDSIKVTVHNKVVPTLTSLNTSCGLKNGSAAVVASNGTPPYTYTWSTTPVIYTAAVDSLAAGTYVVSVSDSANCASTVAVSIAASTAPILSVSATNSNCGTVGTGSASVVVTGGTTPYHYLWNNGDTLPNDFNLKAATYIITVTDVNGCSTFAPAIVSNNNGPVIATTSLVNVTCFGAATGAISVSVSGGTAPYTYNWSNGATTASIGSLYQGPYQLTIMDADSCTSVKTFTINQPKNTISVAASSLRANCGVADGAATVAVSGGTSPYAYSWNNAVSTAKDSDLAAGVYSVIITDGNGCIDSAHVSVSDKNGPALKLTLTSNATCAAGGLLSVAATGINMPFTYAWSNGSSATSIANIPAGNYDVTVTDAHGCVSSADTSVVELAPPAKPLCMVTVDPISNKHNIIVWNKTNATQIASYNVYKESTTAGVYFKIASVPATDSTQFIDTLSDPTVRSWRYELSQVDSCGNESQLSPDQKTMHLTVNQGLGNNINLIWDNYEGLNFSTYYIYKDTINTSFTVIDSIPNNIFTYTDQHYWKTSKPLLYRIGVINPNGCDPAARTLAINYNATKSNTGNITFNPNTVSVNAINTPITDVQVFPNPSTGLVTFALQLPAKEQDLTLSIINTLGQVVLTTQYNGIAGAVSKTIDLATLAKGVYFAKIYNNNSTLYRKIVLQ